MQPISSQSPVVNDSIPKVIVKGSLWKISADSTADMESISFGKGDKVHSFFTSHQLHVEKNPVPRPFQRFQPDWILGVLVFCFILLAWVQFFYPKRLKQILLAPYSKRHLNQLVREGNLFSERIAVGLGLIYLLQFPLMAYQAYDLMADHKYSYYFTGASVYLILLLIFVVFWLIKVFLMRFLGTIFRTQQSTHEYLMNSMLFNFLIGLILLPLMVLVVYIKSVFFLKISLIITALLFLLAFIRGLLIGYSQTRFSYLFLFVYLCSLEILPLIVLMKLFRLYF